MPSVAGSSRMAGMVVRVALGLFATHSGPEQHGVVTVDTGCILRVVGHCVHKTEEDMD